MSWPKGRPRSLETRQAISSGLRFGPRPHNVCKCGKECPKPGAKFCSHECLYADPQFAENQRQQAKNPEWRRKCLAPNGARTKFGRGGQTSPALLMFEPILCPLGYEMDTVTIPIPTGSAYKLDFAHREAKVNIEIDGQSHRGRVIQDARRDDFLRSLGWKVIRIKV